MKEKLIKIKTEDGEICVNIIELHEILGVNQDIAKWIRKDENYHKYKKIIDRYKKKKKQIETKICKNKNKDSFELNNRGFVIISTEFERAFWSHIDYMDMMLMGYR